MKIGILTFQYAINYGAVLQMYSLVQTVQKMGYEVEIIDYIPKKDRRNGIKAILRDSGFEKTNILNIKRLKKSLERLSITLVHQGSLFQKFDSFLQSHFILSKRVDESTWEEMFGQFDAIIVGSDQVWNPINQKGDVYFLNMHRCEKRIFKIAYSVDSTNNVINSEDVKRLKACLDDFKAISVRNIHTKEFVEKITQRNPPIVADPVILNNFDLFCKTVSIKQDQYAFVYLLGKEIEGGHREVLEDIKKKYEGIKIIQIVMVKQKCFTIINEADKKLYDCSPEEWVNLIYNATFIYTDSFHCILFALKYHKNFLAYYAEKLRAPRLLALQKQYCLGNKIVSSVKEMRYKNSMEEELDYVTIDKIFAKEKHDAENYLIDSLSSDVSQKV